LVRPFASIISPPALCILWRSLAGDIISEIGPVRVILWSQIVALPRYESATSRVVRTISDAPE